MFNTLTTARYLLFFVVYTTVISLSRFLAIGPQLGAPMVWPAAGVFFAVLLVSKPKNWWIYGVLSVLGQSVGNWISDVPFSLTSLSLSPFRVATVCFGAYLFKKFSSRYQEYSPQHAILFVLIGGVLTPGLSALISGVWYHLFDDRLISQAFRLHFAGSGLGVLTVTPFVLALYNIYLERNNKIDWPNLWLNGGILLATLIFNILVFATSILPRTVHYELLVVPLLIAISFRGSSALTATSNLLIAMFAFYQTMEVKQFLFTVPGEYDALHNVQFFVGVTTLTHLLLTAAVRRRMEILGALAEKSAELERVNEELDLARRQAMAASEAKSYFLANVSHEIRSPLSAMIGYGELIAREDEEPEQKSTYGRIIVKNGHHLLELVNQILDLSKIEAGQFQVHLDQVRVRPLIEDISDLMSKRARDKGIDFCVEWSGYIPEHITTDDLRLKQILINGLGNAIKFTESGRVILRISCPLDQKTYRLRCEIEDTGIGLDSEEQKNLFHAFQQASSDISRRYGGTGLGLELSRRLARLLSGDYHLLHSVKGKGSIFVLHVDAGEPIKKAVEVVASRDKEASPLITKLSGLNILLVDDAADNRFLISRFLQLSGATVNSAENGRRALERIEDETFDIVLMDIEMPEMNGLEATRRLRSMQYAGPVLALTGRAMPAEIEECLEAGFDGHLIKPVDRDLLIQSVAHWTMSSRNVSIADYLP
jgi:signal transduction histidine kinase/CheY-like chemotaxis protein